MCVALSNCLKINLFYALMSVSNGLCRNHHLNISGGFLVGWGVGAPGKTAGRSALGVLPANWILIRHREVDIKCIGDHVIIKK